MNNISKVLMGLVFILILAGLYSSNLDRYHSRITLQNILNNPEKYDGVYYQASGRISHTEPDFIYILDTEANKEVPVYFPDHGLTAMDSIIIYGPFIYRADKSYFYAEKTRLQHSEPFKYIISFFAILYFIYIFFKEWKLTRNGFTERDIQ